MGRYARTRPPWGSERCSAVGDATARNVPSVPEFPPTDGTQAANSAVTVSGSVSDALSGISSVTCNGAAATLSSGTFSCNLSLNVGVNLLVIRATDAAGNVAGSNFHMSLAGTLAPPQSLQVSPVLVNMLVAETQQFTAVDEHSRPRTDATWSIDNTSVVALSTDPTTPSLLTGVAPGTATLTAAIGSVTAQAQINVLSGTSLAPGTVRWSAPSTPGFTVQQIAQAVPTNNGPDLYSIEIDDNSTPLIRALTADGQQLWATTFASGQYNYGFFGSTKAAMPDGNGGILIKLLANPGTFPQAFQIADIDAQTGTQIWASGPADAAPLTRQMAIRQDGTIFTLGLSQGQPALLGLDPATGATVFAYAAAPGVLTDSTCLALLGHPFGTLSPPTVGPDGTVNSVVTRVDAVVGGCFNPFFRDQTLSSLTQTLSLLQVAQDGTTSLLQLRQDTSTQTPAASFVGELELPLPPNSRPGSAIFLDYFQPIPQAQAFHVIPDGQGGVLAPYVFANVENFVALPSFEKRIVHVSGGAVLNDFALPLTPTPTAEFPMVLGEGTTAFTTDGKTALSYDFTSGQPNWSYSAPSQSTFSIITSAADNGLVGKTTDQNGVDTVQRFDAAGAATQDPWTAIHVGFFGHGSWYGVAQAATSLALYSAPSFQVGDPAWPEPNGDPEGQNASRNDLSIVWCSGGGCSDFSSDRSKDVNYNIRPADSPNSVLALGPSQQQLLRSEALSALQFAFKNYNVTVGEGRLGAHTVYVTGNDSFSCGETAPGKTTWSSLFYPNTATEAQFAVNLKTGTLTTDQLNMLASAVGKGIGNNAAHEIAHQLVSQYLASGKIVAGMDLDDSSTNTYNEGSCDGLHAPWLYTSVGTDGKPIRWSQNADTSLANIFGKKK